MYLKLLMMLKNHYVKLFYVVAIVSVFWAGWEWRDRSADIEMLELQSSIKEMALRVSEERLEKDLVLRNTLARVDDQNAQIEALRQQKDKIVYEEVVKYVQKDNPEPDCNMLSDDWVQLYNNSARANLPTN